eukprot:CAMPEP_0184857164 /NCGR_PEP_ID=MMETSP0580-20130426/2327_1 /TAXON_ID=1118495 /ORGANISM="Dactyliosolen fragilissimus" /LENGTH=158 /DNA_ID=CAMNT_0027352605 /DNA_START=1 /DNA_END=480 /DNA_ORIENTATION=-
MVIVVSDMKILPSDSDMKLVTTDLDVFEEEEDLYRYGAMKGNNAALSQPLLSKVEREAMVEEIKKEQRGMVNEIESKSKTCEETLMKEMKEEFKSREEESKIREEVMMSKIERMSDVEDALFRELKEIKEKLLRFELVVVTLASISIALVAYLSLRQK